MSDQNPTPAPGARQAQGGEAVSTTFQRGQRVRHSFNMHEGIVTEQLAEYPGVVFVQCEGEEFSRSWMECFVEDLATHLRAELTRVESEAAALRARIREIEEEGK